MKAIFKIIRGGKRARSASMGMQVLSGVQGRAPDGLLRGQTCRSVPKLDSGSYLTIFLQLILCINVLVT